mgnify:FL=1|jgi:hypothetical protein
MAEKEIMIYWEDNPDLQTHYVNQMFVSHSDNDFYLIFGEITPVILNENMDIPEKIGIKPVIRIALTPENLKEFIDVLNANYQAFKEKYK